jgi:CheY-like chemotaxis protein
LTAEQHDAVNHIVRGGRHLLGLINEVLDITRIETGNIALSPEAVNVGELLDDAIDLVRPLAEQAGIHIAADHGACGDYHVLADRQRARQVLLNLLSNAVKYNRQRGTVAVSCSQETDGRIRISVADTGPGITPEQQERLFTPFERLGAEQSDVEGTGIGLALSRRLAEAMGGTLGVESTPGRGSRFWFEASGVEGPVERYERLNGVATSAPKVPEGTTPSAVLYIEDNLSNLTLVERVLAQRPAVKVVAAMQGRLGLELARQHEPALILLDLHLPDIGGDEVLERLREDPLTASTPVVIVSADATPGQVDRLIAAGAAGYLTKPIEVADLLRVVDDALAQRHADRAGVGRDV